MLVPIADIQHEAPSTVSDGRLDPFLPLVVDRFRAPKIGGPIEAADHKTFAR